MSQRIVIENKIQKFSEKIIVPGDKSLSIRWVLLASIASGISKSKNLLLSEDVLAAIEIIKKLGIKVKKKNNEFIIFGNGINGYNVKRNLVLDAKNSGTCGRLVLGILSSYENKIKLIGDKSLSKRDFKRIADPLNKFGVKFKLTSNKTLPLIIKGNSNLKPINYLEKRGSAQCKSAVMLAALNANGITKIKAKKSRNHTELLFKYLNIPIKIKKNKNYDFIEINKVKSIKPFDYNIPGDISSSAFFIALAAMNAGSKILIKNVNINPSRIGVIQIFKKMGIRIMLKNIKNYKGEKIANIEVHGSSKIKPINCPTKFNSGAIDEFLIIFLLAAKANGVSYFKDLEELNQKESPRLKWGAKILNLMGIKNKVDNNSIRIYGNPELTINKKIIIKDYLKDHRVFMTSVIAALSFGGEWVIHDKDSINTSFPNFLKIINQIKNNAKK